MPAVTEVIARRADPIEVDDDPERVDDAAYVDSLYREVEGSLQAGMDRLARRRSFPIFG